MPENDLPVAGQDFNPAEHLTVFRRGTFTSEKPPDWCARMYTLAESKGGDWTTARETILGDRFFSVTVSDTPEVDDGEVDAWRVHDGSFYVEMGDSTYGFHSVWIPSPADWLPFHTAHIVPFLQSRAAIYHARVARYTANAIIAFCRHGQGDHIDRNDGTSGIDRRRDAAERHRWNEINKKEMARIAAERGQKP